MSTSKFCIQQRQKEQQRLKKLLIFGFTGSAVLHGILAYALPRWSFEPPTQAQEPIELIIVDKPQPKPKPKQVVQPKPKPVVEPEPEPVVEPELEPKPIVEPEPEPKLEPKKVLTTPEPALQKPMVSAPVENTAPPPLKPIAPLPSRSLTPTNNTSNIQNKPDSVITRNSPPPSPETSNEAFEGISCVSNCEPEYPTALEGVEGSAGVKLTIDKDGNVVGAELADADGNSQVNRQALLAARQMQFSSPGDNSASVQVKIDFTVEGSEYDRARREEQAAKERQEIEAARQQQLEAERQAQQEQKEREKQARQQQQEVEAQPKPAVDAQPAPKPLPVLSEQELEAERLREFRERMEKYRQE